MQRIEDLKELMHTCVETGYLRGVQAMSPLSDRIRKRAAEDYLVRNGLKKTLLGRWVSEGLIREHKGENNSPKWYSLVEINEVIMAMRYKNLVFNSK